MIPRLLFALAALCVVAGPAAADRGRAVIPLPADYFGLHCNRCSTPPMYGGPTTPFALVSSLKPASIRLWQSGVTWRGIEPTRGTFDWSRFDALVGQNEAAGISTTYTLGAAPNFCSAGTGTDPNDTAVPPYDTADGDACWREYVTAVAQRYGARIKVYTLYNEPDVGSWNGSVAQLLRLAGIAYPIIKRYAPGAIVLSPDFSAVTIFTAERTVNLPAWLKAGGGAYSDGFAIHFYLGDGVRPEAAAVQVESVRALLDSYGQAGKPIYDTEDGEGGWRDAAGVIHNAAPAYNAPLPTAALVGGQTIDLQAAYVTRSYLARLATGLLRQQYYFTFDDNDGSGGNPSIMAVEMVKYPSAPTVLLPPALVYRYLARLLPGGWVSNYRRVGNHWELSFGTADGRRGRVYWCDDYATETVTDAAAVGATDNLGNSVALTGGAVRVTGSPVFVFYN